MPCRDSEGVKSQCHISDLRRSAAAGERNPTGGTAVTVWVCQENVTDSVSVHPPEPFHAPTTTTTISHLPPPNYFFSNSYWTFALQKVFFFLNKKSFPLKIPKHQTAFVKLELHGIVFPGSCFNLTSFSPTKKKISILFLTLFSNRDVVLLPFYKVCSL